MKAFLKIGLVTSLLVTLSGCATMFSSSEVDVAFTFSNGEAGGCTILADKEVQQFEVPSFQGIRRSKRAIHLDCETESGRIARHRLAPLEWENWVAALNFFPCLTIVGCVGYLVDHQTGAAHDFPDNAVIVVGDTFAKTPSN